MLLLSLLLCAACQDSLESLVQSLGSEDPAQRTRSAERLLARWKEWTAEDLELLARAASSADVEVSARAKEIVRRVALRKRLGSELLEKFPDADRVLLVEDDGARLKFLLDASTTGKTNRWPDSFVRPLAANAVFSASASAQLPYHVRSGEHRSLVPLLFPSLRAGTPESRLQAVEVVQTLGTKDDCLELVPCLDDGDANVRAAAVRGVGWRIRGPAGSRLKPLLGDASPIVRKSVLSIAGQARITDLRESLSPFLADPDPEFRWLAAQASGRLRAALLAPALALLLEDKNEQVRTCAVEALGELCSREHTGSVARLLKDPSARVRAATVRVLGTLNARETVDAVAALLADPAEGVRSDVAYQLGRWKARRHAKDLLPLLASDETRRAAIFTLMQLDAKETAEALMAVAEDGEKRLRDGFYKNDRGFALVAVGLLGTPEMAPRIVTILKDQNADLRASVFEALARLGASEQSDLMVNYLTDQGSRSWAAQGLAMLGSRRLAPQIAQFARLDRWAREAVMTALGGIGGEDARETILEHLKDPRDYCAEAIGSLAQVGRPEDAPILFPLLDGNDGSLAAIALGELAARGGPERKAIVEKLSAAKTPGARIALLRLGRLTPKEQIAIFDELLQPWPADNPHEDPIRRLSFGPEGIALNRALLAIYEPEALARFEKDLVLEKPLESLEDLHTLLRTHGFTLDVEPANRWGRLPKGTRTSLSRACDWMLEGNGEWEVIDDHGYGHERRPVLQGSTVKLLRLGHQADYWKKRLEGR